MPHFDDSGWSRAIPVAGPGGVLIHDTTPPVEAFETFKPVKITHPKPNLTVYDLGQNLAGWPEIAVIGPRGASVKALIDNAMLSNMVSVLTDCPHREKLGWLEETHLAATSLIYNWDLAIV